MMLKRSYPTLPPTDYFDTDHYQRELQAIWWRDWICVAREEEWTDTGQFQVFNVGGQHIIVTRTAAGSLRAFHNTCRHRGSELCQAKKGTFSRDRIVCPYHSWVYSLEGELQRTPRRVASAGFSTEDLSLYPAAVDIWAGFVFISLAERPGSLAKALAEDTQATSNWPLDELVLAHRQVHRVACNWKIFWENFLECYHCPTIHKDLCELVPLYGKGLTSNEDMLTIGRVDDRPSGSRLKPGAVTWSPDGKSSLPWFEGLSAQEQAVGMTFSSALPSIYLVAHVDYVRSVQVMPLGPETTQLTISWLLLPKTLAGQQVDIQDLTSFGNQVVLEDARICELNQRGLHSIRHERGVLVAQEYDVLAFDNWVLERLGQPKLS